MSADNKDSDGAEANWETVKHIVLENHMSGFTRNRSSVKYKAKQDRLSREFVRVEAYVANELFNAPLITDVDGKKDLDSSGMSQWSGEHGADLKAVLVENDFPYDLASNVKHLVLWCNKVVPLDEVDSIILAELEHWKSKHLQVKVKEYVFGENPVHQKTVPGVFHVHVFLLVE
eukprot:TRINITY_DN14173_c0_g1_i3.p1 TRINITY_DN14173_c0_g1~~TRINITY_DN14173_c0_g1_i3.p1  ORF type:complete len:184 (+),score=45.96 TRINITY_DN14173_c0_g1_i3:32-553(+)